MLPSPLLSICCVAHVRPRSVLVLEPHFRIKLLTIGCALMLVSLLVLTIAFMFDYVSSEDCNENTLEASCTSYSDKCEW